MNTLSSQPQAQSAGAADKKSVLFGYFPQGRQTLGELSTQWLMPKGLAKNADAACAQLDEWLYSGLDIQFKASADFLQGRVSDRRVVKGIRAQLVLAAELQRLLNVPVFEPGYLLEAKVVKKKTNLWAVRCQVPRIDYLPSEFMRQAYLASYQFIVWMLANPCNSVNRARLYQMIDQEFLVKLKPFALKELSILPLLIAAFKRSIPFRHLGSGCYQLGFGAAARLIQSGAVEDDSALGARLSQSKLSTALQLRLAGLPAPTHFAVASREQAVNAVESLGWPVVVKPLDQDRGEGVTMDVDTREALDKAFDKAAALSRQVLIEHQVPGICHRLHVCRGEVIGASRRLPKAVQGDGVQTVKALIKAANQEQTKKPPWQRLKPFPEDAMAQACLARQGYTLDSVLPEKEWGFLRPFASIEWGGATESVLDTIHPDNLAMAVTAAQVFGLASAGIDYICEDISVPWHLSGGVINEVNYSPQTGQMRANNDHGLAERAIEKHLPEDGRIPVEVHIGLDDAWVAAKAARTERAKQGLKAFLVSDYGCLDALGADLKLTCSDALTCASALLMRRDVDVLVLVLSKDAAVSQGMPVDRFSLVTHPSVQNRPELQKLENRLLLFDRSIYANP